MTGDDAGSELDFTDTDPRVPTCAYCGCVVDDIRVGHCVSPEGELGTAMSRMRLALMRSGWPNTGIEDATELLNLGAVEIKRLRDAQESLWPERPAAHDPDECDDPECYGFGVTRA